MKISEIKPNPDNPRNISEEKLEDLKRSITEFEKMMELRPIIIDEDGVILGGNKRYEALNQLGYSEFSDKWVKRANGLSEEQKKEFIIKDNIAFGSWDWQVLRDDWDEQDLSDWGLDAWFGQDVDIDDFFQNEENVVQKEQKHKIILEYTEEDFEKVNSELSSRGGSKEKIIFNLLCKSI